MCEECIEKSNITIPASWYRVDGAIKSNAPDHIKLGNFLKRILPITGDRYCFIKNTAVKSKEKIGGYMCSSRLFLDDPSTFVGR